MPRAGLPQTTQKSSEDSAVMGSLMGGLDFRIDDEMDGITRWIRFEN
jgi:hypothetical protein